MPHPSAPVNPFGIMQGRLSPKPSQRLQAFPRESWRLEFDRARELGFDCIEWLFEADDFDRNPLWSESGRQSIIAARAASGVAIHSICADYFLQHPFFRVSAEAKRTSGLVLRRLIEYAAEIAATVILIPVLEEAETRTPQEADELLEALTECLPLATSRGVRLGLETGLPAGPYAALVQRFPLGTVGAYYDIGNATARGAVAEEEIAHLGRLICGVHVKERRRGGASVPLGRGAANFGACFRALAEARYTGPLILQTAFDGTWRESAARHLQFLRHTWAAVGEQV